MLVECLVALVLLAGGAALVQLVALATSISLDRALQQNAAIRVTDVERNVWMRSACGTGMTLTNTWPIQTGPRITHTITATAQEGLERLSVTTSWTGGMQSGHPTSPVGSAFGAPSGPAAVHGGWTHITRSGLSCD